MLLYLSIIIKIIRSLSRKFRSMLKTGVPFHPATKVNLTADQETDF